MLFRKAIPLSIPIILVPVCAPVSLRCFCLRWPRADENAKLKEERVTLPNQPLCVFQIKTPTMQRQPYREGSAAYYIRIPSCMNDRITVQARGHVVSLIAHKPRPSCLQY